MWRPLSGSSSALSSLFCCIEGGRIEPHRVFRTRAAHLDAATPLALWTGRVAPYRPCGGPRRSFEGQLRGESKNLAARRSGGGKGGAAWAMPARSSVDGNGWESEMAGFQEATSE